MDDGRHELRFAVIGQLSCKRRECRPKALAKLQASQIKCACAAGANPKIASQLLRLLLDEALAWARKAAKVSSGAVEVREIFFRPAPAQD
jgi:hypothetical protein